MARRRLLLQLLLALAAASLLSAYPAHATPPCPHLPASPVHATPPSPLLPAYPVQGAAAPFPLLSASPVDTTPPSPVHATPASPAPLVHETPPSPDVSAAVPQGIPHMAVVRGARRLGPPHLLLSEIFADAPAPSSSDADTEAGHLILYFFIYCVVIPVVAVLGSVAISALASFVVVCLVEGVALAAAFVADRYAAARRERENASRVRPLDQDAVAAAGP